MTQEQRNRMIQLDEAAEKAGGYVDPIPNRETHYDVRKIGTYCKEKGIDPIDMTIRELNRFIVKN